MLLESYDRDHGLERARKADLWARFVQYDGDPQTRANLRAEVASCAGGELPIVRRFSFNVFSLILDSRLGGGELVDVVETSGEQNALFTFDELTRLLAD